MEYKTYGDRAVKLEKWPISSFGPSVNPSITMISARDASASEKLTKVLIKSQNVDKIVFQLTQLAIQNVGIEKITWKSFPTLIEEEEGIETS